jgi:hypothetical protein
MYFWDMRRQKTGQAVKVAVVAFTPFSYSFRVDPSMLRLGPGGGPGAPAGFVICCEDQ